MIGGDGDDNFSKVNNNDTVDGGEGIDFIEEIDVSTAPMDIELESGVDIPDFIYGDTSIINIESLGNKITTGSGDDSFTYNQADSRAGKIINARTGNDLLSVDYSDYAQAIGNSKTDYTSTFEVNNDGDDLLTYFNVEQLNIIGTNFGDSLEGASGNDTIVGGDGDDLINSGAGNDSVIGGEGDDTFTQVNRGDIIDGGTGSDTLQNLNAGDANIDINIKSEESINLDYGTTFIVTSIANIESIDNITTGSGDDSFVYDQADSIAGKSVNGTSGNDFLSVDYSSYQEAIGNTRLGYIFEVNNNSDDLLFYYNIEQLGLTGTSFNDSLGGATGNDSIAGGAGNDSIIGYSGDDYLYGGSGDDTLTGDLGKDSFVFERLDDGIDDITDFSVNDDILVFSTTFDSDLVEGSVNSEMFTIGTTATSNEHRFIYDAGSGDLFYDSDGVGALEQIRIASLGSNLALTSNNFTIGL